MMELDDYNFTEDQRVSLERQSEMDDLLCRGWSFDRIDQDIANFLHNSTFTDTTLMPSPFECNLTDDLHFDHLHYPSPNSFYSPNSSLEKIPFAAAQGFPPSSVVEDEEELEISAEPRNGLKKLARQPSKNLMAERRRRKRLNERLSMLRSIVPKISKMDRTAILADAIDYTKELLEKISNLRQEIPDSNQLGTSVFKSADPYEFQARNTPKFDVERRNEHTLIEIFHAGRSGLLLSTVRTLEASGLEIQHCVISCFNDFTAQASCSEEPGRRVSPDPEAIKQALLQNAGYGRRCPEKQSRK